MIPPTRAWPSSRNLWFGVPCGVNIRLCLTSRIEILCIVALVLLLIRCGSRQILLLGWPADERQDTITRETRWSAEEYCPLKEAGTSSEESGRCRRRKGLTIHTQGRNPDFVRTLRYCCAQEGGNNDERRYKRSGPPLIRTCSVDDSRLTNQEGRWARKKRISARGRHPCAVWRAGQRLGGRGVCPIVLA